ncbi:TPA: hypothetical protein DDW35_06350 [Candidatus Sumerlaeota bacterium]|nr:hypothetical protein [Candidatus Sumerlaeota bacterium]
MGRQLQNSKKLEGFCFRAGGPVGNRPAREGGLHEQKTKQARRADTVNRRGFRVISIAPSALLNF